eukprot:TRINITY_DN4327_c0_g1_i1.p1 TRINITY_DN4327_c0_g1~~TRINITY_DN4327_c0_g1_i1.p1  ORF type:complete len:204 (+),score=19.36 TRINITY_DN4327_c0_g1_i1:99-710(+)
MPDTPPQGAADSAGAPGMDVKMYRLLRVLVGMVKGLEGAVERLEGRAEAAESCCSAQGAVLRELGIEGVDRSGEDDREVDKRATEVAARVQQLTGVACSVGPPGKPSDGAAAFSGVDALATQLQRVVVEYEARLARTVDLAWGSARMALSMSYPDAVVDAALQHLHRDAGRICASHALKDAPSLKRAVDAVCTASQPTKRLRQ